MTHFIRKKLKITSLSLYCITLSIFCQALAFSALSTAPVSALEPQNSKTSSDPSGPSEPSDSQNPSSDPDDFAFESFIADYYLSRADDNSSRLRVVEKLTAIFPNTDQNHGITREIPFTNQGGKNLTLPSTTDLALSLKHNGIVERPYEIIPRENDFLVYIGDPDVYSRGRQLYELEYNFLNVITAPRDNPGKQELYWDTNGTGWRQSFDSLIARVHFADDSIKQAFNPDNISCYVGAYGEQNPTRCSILKVSDGVEFYAYDLAAGENLTFDLEFADGTFTIPEPRYDYRAFGILIAEFVAILFLIITKILIRAKTKSKRKFYRGLFLTPEYAPPHGFTVAEMATNYIGKKVLGSSKVATLMELAVARKIELAKNDKGRKSQWTVKVLSTDLTAEQADVLKLLAGSAAPLMIGQEILVKTRPSDNILVKLDRQFSRDVEERLVATGLSETKKNYPAASSAATEKNDTMTGLSITKKPFMTCDILLIFGILWTIFSVAILPIILTVERPSYIVSYGGVRLIIAVSLLAILIALAAFVNYGRYAKFYHHTEEGLKWSRYLDGLRLYIKMAEKDRLKFLQSVAGASNTKASNQSVAGASNTKASNQSVAGASGAPTNNQVIIKLYEKLLPYAIIFRLEKSWLSEMNKYYERTDVASPDWYTSGAIFSLADLNSAMRSLNSATVATDSSSSFSSGSSGGGFSGGGGGGGGGGGW